MKHYLITFGLIIHSMVQFAQSPTDPSFNKWLRAVINIEVRGVDPKYASTGTAIILEDSGRYYLVTARHMLVDPTAKDSTSLVTKVILVENYSLKNNLSEIKVPNGNFIVKNNGETIHMMNLGAGGPDMLPTIISSIEEDVAIVSLNHRYMDFYKTLIKRGYKPISLKDIDSKFAVNEGDRIFSIGFPQNSVIGEKNNSGAFRVWESSLVSVPVISAGAYLGEYPKNSISFDAMMFVYHGFSGGPVIKDDRMIGFVNGGEIVEKHSTGEQTPFPYFFQNHNRFIKSTVVLSKLDELKLKIKNIKDRFNRDI